ncbi:hypothetical protein CDD80_1526 [Ophiocordyceps camponoti-rufipedis]|uniref:rRNA methyltransferase 2, mitochondrial n=1 Tax=Ophiocordyceps camponoti-rufipedis TaxID=2004952 RepID=A0A2C5Y2E5_9HYPO|nr:hypothetical protein CDD80_1526 [Ophiocordyceps camponoti-rufipedis]
MRRKLVPAIDRVRPHGQVIGIDLLPAQPPRGVSSFQGDFLSPTVRRLLKDFIAHSREQQADEGVGPSGPSYIDRERHLDHPSASSDALVDVVLSDMSAPWDQTAGFNARTLSNPHRRLMNASGIAFRDHLGSMVSRPSPPKPNKSPPNAPLLTLQALCDAALEFASDTLRPGGRFVCKFYQGVDDKIFEQRLKKLFEKVVRDKPAASRSESNESYFIALRRKPGVFIDKASQ